MKLIITGASGFIGKNLVLGTPGEWEVAALYHSSSDFPSFIKSHNLDHVKAIGVDLTRSETFAGAFEGLPREFDACVYLAANGNPAVSTSEPLLDLSMNTCTLINFLEHFGIKRFIYMSSGAVYDGQKGPVSPRSHIAPTLPYSISNMASEQYIKFYKLRRKTIGEYINLRFFGAYGPHEPERKIYTKLTRAFGMDGRNTFTIRGNGENLIDAMYVGDAVEALISVIRSREKNLTMDFCSGTPLTINELVIEAARAFSIKDLRIIHKGSVPEYIRFRPSPKEMREKFGFSPETPLSEGMRRLHQFLTSKNR